MNTDSYKSRVENLCRLVSKTAPQLSFTIMEIGAYPHEDDVKEPFYDLLDYFPASRIIAFEVDTEVCERLNKKSKSNIKYYPIALGEKDQDCTFYETNHPMCCSLYKPDDELLEIYQQLEVAMLKSTGTITTTSLDNFACKEDLTDTDFIKIDVQGAELDVFKGGNKVLEGVVFIVSEVEFIPLYIGQPLFGDVCNYLSGLDFMFHKFLGLSGRAVKPVILNNEPYFPGQHMWSDAIFIRNLKNISELSSDKLIKMGILSYIYGSIDIAYFCFLQYDERQQTSFSQLIQTV